jgi:hypothetical protein
MGPAHRPPRRHKKQDTGPPPLWSDITEAEVLALQEENAKLRERIAELTMLAIMDVIDGI